MNPNLLCESCFEAELPQCSGNIKVNADLTPSTSYITTLTSNKGIKYIENITTDVNGSFEIDVDLLPKGLLIPNTGKFLLTLRSMPSNCDSIDMNFCVDGIKKPFKCLLFSITNTIYKPGLNFIGCSC